MEEVFKGKMLVGEDAWPVVQHTATPVPWPPPPTNWTVLTVDGSFSSQDGSAGVGMISRREDGTVIFAAY